MRRKEGCEVVVVKRGKANAKCESEVRIGRSSSMVGMFHDACTAAAAPHTKRHEKLHARHLLEHTGHPYYKRARVRRRSEPTTLRCLPRDCHAKRVAP